MSMEEKNIIIREYIEKVSEMLNNNYPNIMDVEKIQRAFKMFENSDKDLEQIKEEINHLAKKVVQEYLDYLEFEKQIIDFSKKPIPEKELSPYILDLGSEKHGLYLSQPQIDLLNIVGITTSEEIEDFIKNSEQFPNKKIEDILSDFNSSEKNIDQIEKWKRELYKKYLETLKSYLESAEMTQEEIFQYKLEKLGLPKEEIDMWISNFDKNNPIKTIKQLEIKYGKEFIIKFNRFVKDDYENVKSISYDEMKSLMEFIKRDASIDTIVTNAGKYINTVYQTGGIGYFDKEEVLPLLNGKIFDTNRALKTIQFCKKFGIHMRYHAIFDQSHVDALLAAGKGKEDRDEILAEMQEYVRQTMQFIEKNNVMLEDGTMVINCIEVFNELVEKNKKDKGSPYEMVWEKHFDITIEEIISCFKGIDKPKGVEYMYNETTLTESRNKRQKVEEVLFAIEQHQDGFIDIFGDQMHLSEQDVLDKRGLINLSETAEMHKRIASGKLIVNGKEESIKPKKTDCTEHDLFFTRKFLEKFEKFKTRNNMPKNILPDIKKYIQQKVGSIFKEKGVTVERTGYWSLFDTNDHNYCRANLAIQEENNKRKSSGLEEKPMLDTMYAGLIKKGENFDTIKTLKSKDSKEMGAETQPETHHETLGTDSPEPIKPEFKTVKEKKKEREKAQSNFGEMSPKKQEVYKQQKETTKANNETKTVDKPKTLTLNKPSNPNNGNSSNGSSNSGGFVNMAFMISIIILISIAAVLFAYYLISG